jgi:hypothetical protein
MQPLIMALDKQVRKSCTAAELACFAGIDESEYGSMEALDKQVRRSCIVLDCDKELDCDQDHSMCLSCFAGISESEYGSMEAMDKQVKRSCIVLVTWL